MWKSVSSVKLEPPQGKYEEIGLPFTLGRVCINIADGEEMNGFVCPEVVVIHTALSVALGTIQLIINIKRECPAREIRGRWPTYIENHHLLQSIKAQNDG